MPKILTPEELNKITATLPNLSISTIAGQIERDWKSNSKNGIYFGAVPYLQAMYSMDSIRDSVGDDPGPHVVNYFLSNAQTYRGSLAKVIKAELKRRVAGAK